MQFKCCEVKNIYVLIVKPGKKTAKPLVVARGKRLVSHFSIF